MRYTVAVFFDGPRCGWGERLDPTEIVYTAPAPWLWLARVIARGNLGNTGRLAYAITEGEKTIEEQRARVAYEQPA